MPWRSAAPTTACGNGTRTLAKPTFRRAAKSMLGYAEDEIGDDIEEWHSRIHPDDLERALAELQAHLDGHTHRFEFEHRMRHKDGTWRWVLARAAAVRHASGKPERLVGLYIGHHGAQAGAAGAARAGRRPERLARRGSLCGVVQKFAAIIGAREAFLTRVLQLPRHAGAHAGLLV